MVKTSSTATKACCPPHGDWEKEGSILTVNGPLFFESQGVRMRGRKRITDNRSAFSTPRDYYAHGSRLAPMLWLGRRLQVR